MKNTLGDLMCLLLVVIGIILAMPWFAVFVIRYFNFVCDLVLK